MPHFIAANRGPWLYDIGVMHDRKSTQGQQNRYQKPYQLLLVWYSTHRIPTQALNTFFSLATMGSLKMDNMNWNQAVWSSSTWFRLGQILLTYIPN